MPAASPIEGGLALVLMRGAADAALLSLFGALLFRVWLAPPVLAHIGGKAPAVMRRLDGIVWSSLVAVVLFTLGWAAVQSIALSGSLGGLPVLLQETVFGHLVLARLGLFGLVALALTVRRPWAVTALAGVAVASQAGHGHALAMYEGPSWLLLSEALHLLAAAAWLGGLVPLLVLVAAVPPAAAALASERFSPLGTGCVLVLAATALVQGLILVGTPLAWIGTDYGLVALAKLGLLVVLLAFAARNRFRLTPALHGAAPGSVKRRLVRSVAGETAVGLLVVCAASLLSSLPPAMHEQPLWPFPWRLSMEAVREDAALGQEALVAMAVMAGAAVAVVAAFVLRFRARWLVSGLAVVAAGLAVPHFAVLLAEAYPTQYWQSPTGFSSASIANGAALYPAYCASCHGVEGRGDGLAAGSLPVPPADLTAAHLWDHGDGELFWWLTHGIRSVDGGLAMPGFADTLTPEQRWALIDWIRANNAGLAYAETGAWPLPIQAPGLEVTCADGRTVTLNDMHGQVVRIVFGPATAMPGVFTIQVASNPDAHPDGRLCVTDAEEAMRAYAAIMGLAVDKLPGTQILVDGAGWMRALQRPDSALGWNDPAVLADAVQEIERHPVAADRPQHHSGMQM